MLDPDQDPGGDKNVDPDLNWNTTVHNRSLSENDLSSVGGGGQGGGGVPGGQAAAGGAGQHGDQARYHTWRLQLKGLSHEMEGLPCNTYVPI